MSDMSDMYMGVCQKCGCPVQMTLEKQHEQFHKDIMNHASFENFMAILKEHIATQVNSQIEEKIKDWEPEHTINLKVTVDSDPKL